MITGPDTAGVYTDFAGLTQLKAEARQQTPEAVRETARQFEALFIQLVLKAVREADQSMESGLFDSSQSRFYQEMYDQQMALQLSRGQGIGLTDSLARQLTGGPTDATGDGDTLVRQPFTAPAPRQSATEPATGAGEAARPEPARFDSPEQFVETVLPQIREAAAEIGVDPLVLLAQAALETGWGRSVIRTADGTSSHNLFNIKADARWGGERAQVTTLEFEGGQAVRRPAAFRVYGSYAESARDYVQFLRDNPRYGTALEQAADPEAFLRALHRAGYATDPAYVEKIQGVLRGEALRTSSADASLKSAG